MYATNQFRKGLKVEIEGVPYEIVDFQHVSPGKGRAFTRTKLKNMLNQNVIERTITSGDKLDRANTEESEMQYLYQGRRRLPLHEPGELRAGRAQRGAAGRRARTSSRKTSSSR